VTRGGAGTGDYLYRFVYKYTYTVGTVTFIDRGAVTEVALTSALAPNTSTVAISAIPVLANGATYNWDTTAIKVEIYRTTTDRIFIMSAKSQTERPRLTIRFPIRRCKRTSPSTLRGVWLKTIQCRLQSLCM
jgi:hypothetical protein